MAFNLVWLAKPPFYNHPSIYIYIYIYMLLDGCLHMQVCLEAEVMKTLKGLGLPVPQVYHIEPCPEFIGTEFFIMEYVEVCVHNIWFLFVQ